jgi:hypothetical protein
MWPVMYHDLYLTGLVTISAWVHSANHLFHYLTQLSFAYLTATQVWCI